MSDSILCVLAWIPLVVSIVLIVCVIRSKWDSLT